MFSIGTSSHTYLEFDVLDTKKHKEFASTISAIREPRTTTGGVNFVIGFRPELCRDMVPDDVPPGVEGFNKQIQGIEGFVMPSTQHDALVWLSGSAYVVIFDMARSVAQDLVGQASLAEELLELVLRARSRSRRLYRAGSENPTTVSMLPVRLSCPKEFPVLPAPSFCCKSGSTRPRIGKLCQSRSRNASWDALKLDSA